MSSESEYIHIIREDYFKYKLLAEKAFAQLKEKDFHFTSDESSNSIAIIIQHISGNIKSRFTDFFTSDGEKPTRNRDDEFEDRNLSINELMKQWEESWRILENLLKKLNDEDLTKTVYIRNEPHSVIKALNRSVTHYAYHTGQIIQLAKIIKKDEWKTLSVAKGKSKEFNEKMFKK